MQQHKKTDPVGLEHAFNTFNQLSVQLTESYRILESRVAGLNEELASARDDRIRELTEKERLASRLELLLNALPGGIVVLDGQGVIQEHNPAAVEMLGEPLLGQTWTVVIERAFAPRADDRHDISLADGRRVNLSTCPLGSEPGQILLITDVTEMRQLQDRLNQQQRLAAMGETAASLAHQIRTPLASALLYASNLKRRHVSEEDRIRVGEKIFSRLRHLEQLVNNMLMYARGNTVGEEDFTVAELLGELQHTLDVQLTSTSTSFAVEDLSAGVYLHGNRQMLLSGLINLVVNAIQAMGNDGQIMISACVSKDDFVELHIIDNGPGIEAEKQQQIFSPFYTTRKEGTGLGLAVVEAIMRAHKGSVHLESTHGRGCRFILRLPLVSEDTKSDFVQLTETQSVSRIA